jgi:hypothetical protein
VRKKGDPGERDTERTRALRPMFTGTLHLPSRSAPEPESPAPSVRAPAPPPVAPGAGRITRRVADLAECRRRFRAVFDADSPLPLAIGIHKPLGELIGTNRMKFPLEWWTSWPAYVAAIAAGGCWYNLDGTEAGEITEEQRQRHGAATRRAGSLATRAGQGVTCPPSMQPPHGCARPTIQ